MDPQACLQELLGELASTEPDRDRIEELLEALHGWVKRGGFLPTVFPTDHDGALTHIDSSELFHVPRKPSR